MKGVAITGVGLVSALGRGMDAHLDALKQGRSGLAPLRLFATQGLPESPVGEVLPEHLATDAFISRSESLALTAARDALKTGGPAVPGAIVVGTTTGGIYESEQHYLRHRGQATAEDRRGLRHHPAGKIADRLGSLPGLPEAERHTFATACSSSANAIGYAAMRVAAGLPWALAGGVDSLCRLTYDGFHALKLLALACRPFDASRRGLALGEAAAFLLLEPEAVARARGAEIFGYVAGWGCTADAHHMTAPHPEGRGAIAAIRGALTDARITPADVSFVNAHGTATPANDAAEALALQAVFGEAQPPVSSTKGATGHTLGAAGALEAALALLSLRESFVPHTVGLENLDPRARVNHVPRGGLTGRFDVALSSSFGFGGNNAALVLTRERR